MRYAFFSCRVKFIIFFAVLLLPQAAPGYGQDLSIAPGDIRITRLEDGGLDLYIRKKPDIGSVLITETTRDPMLQADNYAYRAAAWNAVNGNEIRILDGEVIPPRSRVWSLIDSTVERHPELGDSFHIYIPYVLYYGYTDTRHGEVYVVDGTYLNLRAFALPYGDYRGHFQDNPYVLQFAETPPLRPSSAPPPAESYSAAAREAFESVSRGLGGGLVYASGPQDLVEQIRALLEKERGKTLDLVLCLDTTRSMRESIGAVRDGLVAMLENILPEFAGFRIGIVLYRDYEEEYLTRAIPFTRDFAAVRRRLDSISTGGGGDAPEAVYEALHTGAVNFLWEAESRLMILVGDAPPHPRPKGTVTRQQVDREAAARDLRVHAIILPQRR